MYEKEEKRVPGRSSEYVLSIIFSANGIMCINIIYYTVSIVSYMTATGPHIGLFYWYIKIKGFITPHVSICFNRLT
jgi:hypothetical protein